MSESTETSLNENVIFILPKNLEEKIPDEFLPIVEDHNDIIVYSSTKIKKHKSFFGCIDNNDKFAFAENMTGKTMVAYSKPINKSRMKVLCKEWSGCYVINLNRGSSIKFVIDSFRKIFDNYFETYPDESKRILSYFSDISEKKVFSGRVLNTEGKLTDVIEYTTDDAEYVGWSNDKNAEVEVASERSKGEETEEEEGEVIEVDRMKLNWRSKNRTTILNLVDIVIEHIQYDGFSPREGRKVFIKKFEKNEIVVKNLMLMFTAYSNIGNNVSKLTVKRVNVETGRKLMDLCNTIGIVKKAKSKTDITLPRLAISFMPEYLVFRKLANNKLQNQTKSEINVHYKDISFNGCKAIRNMPGYIDFHKEFSSLIHNKGKKTKLDDPEFLESLNRFSDVAESGYMSDVEIHESMTEAISLDDCSKEFCFNFMLKNIDAFRKKYFD